MNNPQGRAPRPAPAVQARERSFRETGVGTMRNAQVDATLLFDTDFVARDRDGRVILFVEVKARKDREVPASEAQWVRSAEETGTLPPFFMRVDLENVAIYRRDERPVVIEVEEDRSVAFHPLTLITHLKTAAVLGHYDAEFGRKSIYTFYLGTLVEVWLDDLAYHWKSETPPGSDRLATIGLLPRLEGGSTEAERPTDGDPLR
jgi:hypothetical protein